MLKVNNIYKAPVKNSQGLVFSWLQGSGCLGEGGIGGAHLASIEAGVHGSVHSGHRVGGGCQPGTFLDRCGR